MYPAPCTLNRIP